MQILQLCCRLNLWPDDFQVTSIDLNLGSDINMIPIFYGTDFSFVCAAPPCVQFTRANVQNWLEYPIKEILIAQKCFNICLNSRRYWFLENPPGRIEKFIPALKKYRTITWQSYLTKKEYVIYSNFLIMQLGHKRYSGKYSKNNQDKKVRESWEPDLISDVIRSLNLI